MAVLRIVVDTRESTAMHAPFARQLSVIKELSVGNPQTLTLFSELITTDSQIERYLGSGLIAGLQSRTASSLNSLLNV